MKKILLLALSLITLSQILNCAEFKRKSENEINRSHKDQRRPKSIIAANELATVVNVKPQKRKKTFSIASLTEITKKLFDKELRDNLLKAVMKSLNEEYAKKGLLIQLNFTSILENLKQSCKESDHKEFGRLIQEAIRNIINSASEDNEKHAQELDAELKRNSGSGLDKQILELEKILAKEDAEKELALLHLQVTEEDLKNQLKALRNSKARIALLKKELEDLQKNKTLVLQLAEKLANIENNDLIERIAKLESQLDQNVESKETKELEEQLLKFKNDKSAIEKQDLATKIQKLAVKFEELTNNICICNLLSDKTMDPKTISKEIEQNWQEYAKFIKHVWDNPLDFRDLLTKRRGNPDPKYIENKQKMLKLKIRCRFMEHKDPLYKKLIKDRAKEKHHEQRDLCFCDFVKSKHQSMRKSSDLTQQFQQRKHWYECFACC